MARSTSPFVSITSTGGLLPTATLERLAAAPEEFPATAPTDYGLLATKKLRQAINQDWADLLDAWQAFRTQVPTDRPDGAGPLTDVTWRMWHKPLLQVLGWGEPPEPRHQPDPDLFGTDDPVGIPMDNTLYPVTREVDGVVPVHVLGAGVPLDRRTPGVFGADKQSPHSMIQTLLNASDLHLWAIICNGKTLRLVRDTAAMTRQSYVEFDLATMFDSEVFADFQVLWLTCHRSRFPSADAPATCVLEQWQDLAGDHGVAALNELRDAVEGAIQALATGALSHPANVDLWHALDTDTNTRQDLYRACLRTVYQWLFVLVLEDKDLLHPPTTTDSQRDLYEATYSLSRLRSQARSHVGGQHPDAWRQWRSLHTAVSGPHGIPQLGVPTLTGGMFDADTTALLNDCEIANRHLYAAVRSLTYLHRDGALHRINFRNLGSQELGSIYESLLELDLVIDTTARSGAVETRAGNDRKTTGAYYTPDSLVKVLLDEALDPVVADVTANLASDDERERAILGFARRPDGTIDRREDDRPLTVCDPAMGSAHFLVAAAHRLARHVALLRSHGDEPDRPTTQQALRDVVAHCLYGVDINPMATEIAKIALWLECHVPGQPLTFLDHHLKVGNGLLGVGFDTSMLDYHRHTRDCAHSKSSGFDGGLPNEAFKDLAGDDKKVARSMRDAFKAHASGQENLLSGGGDAFDFDAASHVASTYAARIGFLDDSDADGLSKKAKAHRLYGEKDELERLTLRADAYVATWTMKKNANAQGHDLPFHVYVDSHYDTIPAARRDGVVTARGEAARLRFFHWPHEYPEIAAAGGFDVMLGNPPWERIKLQAKEWFASRGRTDIAGASRASVRNKMIAALKGSSDPVDKQLAADWEQALHEAAALSQFIRSSGRFPLGGVGDVNTYAVFADHFLASHSRRGAAGIICPVGLATGATYGPFFGHLVENHRIASFYSFWNHDRIFPEVNDRVTFACVTFVGEDRPAQTISFTGYVWQPSEIADPGRRYVLTPEDIAAINPNTKNAPLFRRAGDAPIVAKMHRSAGVLVNEAIPESDLAHNPWGIDFLRMFDMANSSGLFRGEDWARDRNGELRGNVWSFPDGTRALPLYEGKLVWFYDHRAGTYEGQTTKQKSVNWIPATTDEQHRDPRYAPKPGYWLEGHHVAERLKDRWERDWFIGWRDVARASDERTLIASVVPRYAVGDKLPLMLPATDPTHVPVLLAAAASFAVDFRARNAADSGMKQFVVRQLPLAIDLRTPVPGASDLLSFVAPRVAELTYTAYDLAAWADDIGFGGRPFIWDQGRRTLLQAELDAAMFHVYGLDRGDVEWVMDSFESLAGKESRPPEKGGYSEFRTKRLILERYDAMSEAVASGRSYGCPLDVPPAHDAVRHS